MRNPDARCGCRELHGGTDHGCSFSIEICSYAEGRVSMPALMSHARSQSDVGRGVCPQSFVGDAGRGKFHSLLVGFGVKDATYGLMGALGDDLVTADFGYAWDDFSWNYGDRFGDYAIVHYPESQTVIQLGSLSCSG